VLDAERHERRRDRQVIDAAADDAKLLVDRVELGFSCS